MYRAGGPAPLKPVGELEFANGVAAVAASETFGKTKVCAGIVAYADLMLGEQVEEVLEAMILAGGGRFRGIRYISASHPDEAARGSSINRPSGLLLHAKVREGLAQLPPLGLSSHACTYLTTRDELAAPARAAPCA